MAYNTLYENIKGEAAGVGLQWELVYEAEWEYMNLGISLILL